MKTYKTSDIAKMIGIHVNTVRLYEKCNLIPAPERLSNGYRVFTELHMEQFKLARAMLCVEVVQNGLRKKAIDVIKISAFGNYEKAEELVRQYIAQIDWEKEKAEEAIEITQEILSRMDDKNGGNTDISYTRKETAEILNVTIDTLRNWELNGLFTIKRCRNGYRMYTEKDLERLKIIYSLRCANYSLSAILRMLCEVSVDPTRNIREVIDTPQMDDTIITVCDKLLTSLSEAKKNAQYAFGQIQKMKKISKSNNTFSHQT